MAEEFYSKGSGSKTGYPQPNGFREYPGGLVTIACRFSQEDFDRIREEAERQQKPFATIVRQAVSAYIKRKDL